MTKYSVSIETETCDQSVALFDERASMDAMISFAMAQSENGNSLETPGYNVYIFDLTTGEIVWDWRKENEYCDIPEEGYDPYDVEWDDHYWDDGCPAEDVDESNYDPYLGCDVYEVELFDLGGDF